MTQPHRVFCARLVWFVPWVCFVWLWWTWRWWCLIAELEQRHFCAHHIQNVFIYLNVSINLFSGQGIELW